MTFSRLLARQLGNPSRITGKFAAFVWNQRNSALNDVVFDRLTLETTDRVLEIGFGGGYLLGRISEIVTAGLVAGVDISPAMLAQCEKRFRTQIRAGALELKCAPAESLTYPSGYFTKVCSTNSIFYWQDIERAMSEIVRVLRPGGNVVLCFTNKNSLAKKSFAENIRLVEADEIQALMAATDIQQISTNRSSDQYRDFICITGKKSP